jgi:hypothetical protein
MQKPFQLICIFGERKFRQQMRLFSLKGFQSRTLALERYHYETAIWMRDAANLCKRGAALIGKPPE